MKLFMLLLGCRPKGRFTEQHDIFFAIGSSLKAIIPDIHRFWKDAGSIHIDAWREVTEVDGYGITVEPRATLPTEQSTMPQLFFINLGGYKPGEFEEYHYKMLAVSGEKSEAIRQAKQTAFYKHTGFNGAESHIDDKYGIDVDDIHKIEEILPAEQKEKFHLLIKPAEDLQKDEWHLGYTMLTKVTD
jgi:hypothetical protein